MLQCPKCGSADTHRSRPKSAWETWRKHITDKCPYRCGKCGWRGWTLGPTARLGDAFSETPRVIEFATPQMSDAPLAAGRPSVDELDLDALDIPHKSSQSREFY